MVFLNPGKPSGHQLSGNLHLRLSITSMLIEATHKHSLWMVQPLFFLSLKQISVYLDVYQMAWRARMSYQKHVACTLECCRVYRAGGGRARLWGQPVRLPSLAMCPLSLWRRCSRLQMRSSCPSYDSTMVLEGVV